MSCKKKILFYVQEDWYFISHRLALAVAAIENQYEVVLVTRVSSGLAAIASLGVRVIELDTTRGSLNPLKYFIQIIKLGQIIKKERPDIVHNISLMSVMIGGIASSIFTDSKIVNSIAGMGSLVVNRSLRYRFLYFFVKGTLKWQGLFSKIIVQNRHDQLRLLSIGVPKVNIKLIQGSGVNLHEFSYQPECDGVITIVMHSRLLKDKGVDDFVIASRIIAQSGVRARFVLIGRFDKENPSSVTEDEIQKWVSDGVVEYLGWVRDVRQILVKSHIVCLPSKYGEGIPKGLLEAAAIGRAIVTTDIPGCRDVVVQNYNGLLVPPGQPGVLAQALIKLIKNPEMRKTMGLRGRTVVEKYFGLDDVNRCTLALYGEVLI
jgi:glycosyltransferase involved in cell wall biosynthesis